MKKYTIMISFIDPLTKMSTEDKIMMIIHLQKETDKHGHESITSANNRLTDQNSQYIMLERLYTGREDKEKDGTYSQLSLTNQSVKKLLPIKVSCVLSLVTSAIKTTIQTNNKPLLGKYKTTQNYTEAIPLTDTIGKAAATPHIPHIQLGTNTADKPPHQGTPIAPSILLITHTKQNFIEIIH